MTACLPACQSALQPWVSLGLLYNQSPLLGFRTKLFFTGWGKIMTTIILNRIREQIDRRLKKEQAGFRKDHSCVDQIKTLKIIIEQSNEWNERLYLVLLTLRSRLIQ
jgi:hypothetical protein